MSVQTLFELSGLSTRIAVRADEKLTEFIELESAIHEFAVNCARG